jgi:hypothetical protein
VIFQPKKWPTLPKSSRTTSFEKMKKNHEPKEPTLACGICCNGGRKKVSARKKKEKKKRLTANSRRQLK